MELPYQFRRHIRWISRLDDYVKAKGSISPSENGSTIEIRFVLPLLGKLIFLAFCLALLGLAGLMAGDAVTSMPANSSIEEQVVSGLSHFFTNPMLLPIAPLAWYVWYGYQQAHRILRHRLKLIMAWEEPAS